MAYLFGDTYTQGTAKEDSFSKAMELVVKDKASFWQSLPKETVISTTHTWTYDTLAKAGSNQASPEFTMATTAIGDLSTGTNYTQIVYFAYGLSRTQANIAYQGVGDRLLYEKKKAMMKLAIEIDYALINSTGATGASATARQVRGLQYWCTGVNSATGNKSTFGSDTGSDLFNTTLKSMIQNGGMPNSCLVNPDTKQLIDAWTVGSTKNVEQNVTKRTLHVEVFESSFGYIEMMMDNNVTNADVYIMDIDKLACGYLTGGKPQSNPLAKLGDGHLFEVLSEFTLIVRDPVGSVGFIDLSAA